MNKRAVIMSTAALTVIGGGAAVAFWTNTSVNYGAAKVSNPALSVSAPTTTDPAFQPDSTQKFVFHLTNNGDAPANLTAAVLKVAGSDGSPWIYPYGEGCSSADFQVGTTKVVNGATETDFAPQALPANATLNLSVTVKMLNDAVRNQDACKATQPPLYVTVS